MIKIFMRVIQADTTKVSSGISAGAPVIRCEFSIHAVMEGDCSLSVWCHPMEKKSKLV